VTQDQDHPGAHDADEGEELSCGDRTDHPGIRTKILQEETSQGIAYEVGKEDIALLEPILEPVCS
jgi:hypothetical protein